MAEDDLDLDDEDEDDDKDEDDDDDDDEEEGRPSKGGGRTKLYVFIGGAALLGAGRRWRGHRLLHGDARLDVRFRRRRRRGRRRRGDGAGP